MLPQQSLIDHYATAYAEHQVEALRVLIVDDSETDRRLLRKLVESAANTPVVIDEACTIGEAVDRVAGRTTHLIMLDDHLSPSVRAWHTLAAIRAVDCRALVCIATAFHDKALHARMMDDTAVAYFDKQTLKPDAIRQFLGLVRRPRKPQAERLTD